MLLLPPERPSPALRAASGIGGGRLLPQSPQAGLGGPALLPEGLSSSRIACPAGNRL